MPIVLSVITYLICMGLLAAAVLRNLKDAHRATSLKAQIVSLKEEFELQTREGEKFHREQLERKDKQHDLELRRVEAYRDAACNELLAVKNAQKDPQPKR